MSELESQMTDEERNIRDRLTAAEGVQTVAQDWRLEVAREVRARDRKAWRRALQDMTPEELTEAGLVADQDYDAAENAATAVRHELWDYEHAQHKART